MLVEKKVELAERAKQEISVAEKKLKEMEGTYRLLDNTNKAYYSSKLSSFQKDWTELRRRYFQMEDNLNAVRNQEQINAGTLEGANERLRQGNRERLLNGVENLDNQGNQIDRLKGIGVETHEQMRDANRELKDQGHFIESASEKVHKANASTTRTKKKVVQMTRKEYWYKFILYVLIVLLFLADIASIISFVS